MKKLSNTGAVLKKALLIKKRVYIDYIKSRFTSHTSGHLSPYRANRTKTLIRGNNNEMGTDRTFTGA